MIDIFYKSYSKDFKLLYYSLQSLTKNVTGYNKVVILIPELDRHLFDTRILPERTEIHYVNEYGNGYLFQQVCKIKAHNYSSADFIMFSDSDLIFDHPINLQDFILDGKPEILMTSYYGEDGKNQLGDAICWKQATETMFGEFVDFEYMRRNNLIYHRETLVNIESKFPNIEYTIMQSKSFSEFNFIGFFAEKYESDKYNFVNTNNWVYTPPKSIQLWSWFDKNSKEDLHIYEYKRALETINNVLGLTLTEL